MTLVSVSTLTCADRSVPDGVTINPAEESVMKWEIPQAIDMRFGMEITMYIANR